MPAEPREFRLQRIRPATELAGNALADALKGQRIIEQATAQFRHSQARHDRVIDEELVRSEKLVREADERISGYVKATISGPHVTLLSGAASGGGGSWSAGSVAASSAASPDCYSNGTGDASAPASWRDTPGVTIPAGFDGFALVPVSLIRNSDPISGPESFDKGRIYRRSSGRRTRFSTSCYQRCAAVTHGLRP